PEAAAGVEAEAGEHGAAEGVDAGGADLREIEVQPEGVPEGGRAVAGGEVERGVADLGEHVVVQIDHQRLAVERGHLVGDGDRRADHETESRAATSCSWSSESAKSMRASAAGTARTPAGVSGCP